MLLVDIKMRVDIDAAVVGVLSHNYIDTYRIILRNKNKQECTIITSHLHALRYSLGISASFNSDVSTSAIRFF